MWKKLKPDGRWFPAILLCLLALGPALAATITVNESTQYQTIDGFGAFGFRSNNWSNPSDWWSDSFGNTIIGDLGLTIHRNEYYPPESGQDTQFSEQAPYFQLIRDKAIQLGEPLKIIITYWTPPSWMKSNGSPDGGYLLSQYYDDFGNYTVDARDDFAGIGVDVYAWSLQNEPLFSEPYNSCVYTAEQYRDMLKVAGPIIHSSYPNLKLFGSEHMLWGITRDWDWDNLEPDRKVKDDSQANAQMGIWACHGYSDGVNPDPSSQADWVLARQRLDIDNTGRHFWMTETSGFSDTWSGDTGAFSLGTQIFSGLKYGHLSAWVWWQLSEPGGGNYVLMDYGTPNKKYYVSKQFYRYIRPDAVMVDAGTDDSGVHAAAFTHSANNTLTIVLINNSGGQRTMNLNISGSIIPSQLTIYRTSSSQNCANVGTVSPTGQVTLPNSTITTLFGTATGPPPPGQASNPSPANGATGVSVEADISWTAGSDTTSHDVYFGQDSTPDSGEFQGNQPGTTFDPGTLAASTTYYWRIDEVGPGGTTTGVVWSFTTEAAPQPPGQASNPNPASGATDVSIDADLSWTAGSGTTSHDVYFGTDSTPDSGEFQGNQTGATFDPGTLAENTTYYWRIDEKNAVGTTTGVVWSFTTGLAPAGLMDVIITTDDEYDLYVNGQYIGSDTSWENAETYSSIELQSGENVVAVVGVDTGWAEGVLAELIIDSVREGTSTSWKVSLSPGTGWESPGFDDSGWANASDRGAYGTGDWGTNVSGMPTDTPAHWIWSAGAEDTPVYVRYSFTLGPPPPPGQASNPSPSNGATGVSATADLSWTAGSGATSHDVYFGTNSTPDSGEFQGNQAGTTFDPGTLAYSTTYYWRIDSVNAGGTTTGVVWSFTTAAAPPPGQASNPSPANGAAGVSINADLSWTAGSGATSHDVYFGTDSTPDSGEFQGNQTGTTFDPGTLAYSTTYYWRIDEVGAGGTTTGVVWSFTTEAQPGAAIEYDSVGSNASGTDGTTLSWSHTVGSGSNRILVVGVAAEDSSSTDLNISSVTYGGTAMTLVANSTRTEGTTYLQRTALYYLLSPAVGTATVTVTYAGSVAERNGGSISLRNAKQAAAEAVATNGNTGSNSISVNITTLTNGSWVIDAVGCGNAGTFSATGGNTERYDVQGDSASGAGSTKLVASAGSTTVSWTHSGANRLAQSAAAFAPVGVQYPPGQATNPNPANGATGVSINADLSWSAGTDATSHDVYFGTTSPGTFQGNQAGTTFDPGTLAYSTTYYWRIDEKNAAGTTTGVVWSFTTEAVPPPGQATNPSPANGATDVSIDPSLSWTAGSGATSHDVYFGTDSTPDSGEFQGNQAGTTFDPGTLFNETTYYWRIDEVGPGGTTTGVVWSFTTEPETPLPGQATNPNPADGATDVSTTTDLSWTAGSDATSHDVYFGTSSPGTFQGNQTDTTFDPGTLANDTTYYWRIDSKNAIGTTTGVVWSFTTGAVPVDIQLDSVGSNSNGTDGTTLSWSHTVGSGSNRILIVAVAGEDSSSTDLNISSVTYGGTAMTLVPNSTSTEGTTYLQKTALYYLLSPAVGTATVTVTYSGSVAERSGGSISLFNVDQAGAEAVATNGNTGSNSISTNITTLTDGSWVIDVVGCGNAGTFTTTTSGMTERYDVQNDSASAAGSTKPVASAGSTTVSWQHSGANRLAHSAAAFAPLSGPPVPPEQATNPDPADGATDVSVNADLSWTAGSGATSHDVYFGQTTSPPFIQNQAGTTYDPGTLSEVTTYYWRIDEVGPGGTTTGNVWSFTTAAPSEWISQDIGSPGVAGSASETAGTWTVNGDGSDISGTSDSFHYVYQPISGDCEIIARVVSLENITADWAKAGLMFRETLAANSTYALNNYTTNVADTVHSWTILHRDTTGGTSTQTVWGTDQAPPYWMRLVRSGNNFSAYVSSNGSSWTLIDTVTISMATDIYVGMAVTSHDSGNLSTGTFDNVQLND